MQAVKGAVLGEIATEIRDKLQKVINFVALFYPYSSKSNCLDE
jgi:hypothetical protein